MPFLPATTLSAFDPVPPDPRGEPEALTRLRHEYGAKLRRLEETVLSLDNLLSPQDWVDAGDGFPAGGGWRVNRPAQRTQDRTHAPLAYLSEEEWRYHVAVARDLVTRNHLALGFRDHVCGFLGSVSVSFVLRGHEPGASAPGAATDPLVRAATGAWDEWRELAEWGQGEEDREEECRRRLIVEGEATLRFFVGDDGTNGLPLVRHIEPELIRTPPGQSTTDPAGWGVVTHPDDDEREEGLWVCDPADVSRGRVVASSEYVRVKGNTDRTVKRGLSDFLPVGAQLGKVLGLLDNMAHVSRLQAAIAWWEQYPTATLDQVVTQVRLGADYQRAKVSPGSAGTGTEVTSYEPGTVVRTEGGREVKPGPVASGIAGFESVERMVLRGIGFRWGCPSYFSGDGDASFASVLVTGSPFVRVVTARQQKLKGFARAVAGRFVAFCERSGRLPAGASRRLRAVATAEPVVMADEEKQARTFLSLFAQNCADPVEFIRSRGGDPAVVAANIRAWKQKFEPPAPGPGPGVGGGPTAAPPGSAGGDGSSPNANPMGEGRRVQENAGVDSHGNPEPATAAGDGLKWELRPYHHNGTTSQRWTRVRIGDGAADPAGAGAPATALDPGASNLGDTASASALRDALVNASDDAERLRIIARAGAKTETQAEAAGWVLLGENTKWQIGTDASSPPVGNGHDLRRADGALLRLTDVKTRESKNGVVLTDPERLSKIAEALQALETSTVPVVPGYLHIHKSTGTTFVTGFAPGESSTYSPAKPAKSTHKGAPPAAPVPTKLPSLHTDLGSWKAAVRDRLSRGDELDEPIPALQLAPELTTSFDKWTPERVQSARQKYEAATRFLADPEIYGGYRALVTKQAVDRVAGLVRQTLAAAGRNRRVAADTIVDALAPHLKSNPVLQEALANVDELQDAFARNKAFRGKVVQGLTPDDVRELTDEGKSTLASAAVGALPAEHKAAVLSAGLSALTDEEHEATLRSMSAEERKRLFARLVALDAAQTGTTPTNPPK